MWISVCMLYDNHQWVYEKPEKEETFHTENESKSSPLSGASHKASTLHCKITCADCLRPQPIKQWNSWTRWDAHWKHIETQAKLNMLPNDICPQQWIKYLLKRPVFYWSQNSSHCVSFPPEGEEFNVTLQPLRHLQHIFVFLSSSDKTRLPMSIEIALNHMF